MRTYFFIVLLVACASRSEAAYSGGNGTGLDPYLVATARDLADLTADQDNWSRHFRQVADIDMSDLPAPLTSTIGNEELPFSGVFDGDGRIIRNLVCTNPGGDTAGLFGQVRGSDTRIQNVVMVDPNVEAEGAQYVGIAALVGRLRSGRVTCCRIEDACVRGYSSVGALVGWNQGEVSHCEATGTVSGIYSVGGLVGTTFWGLDIHHCRAEVTVTGVNRVGGLVGNCALASIAWCSSSGNVEGCDYVGGFAGSSEGGILGNCYAIGSVSGTARVGGLLGQNSWSCDCSAGAYPSELSCCYAVGLVTGESQTGGLVGADDNCLVFGCFWNVETCGQEHSETGTPSTTIEMQTQETFLNANWDFTPKADSLDFWVIQEGRGYPLPAWQIVEGDFNRDGVVNLDDFGTLAPLWHATAGAFWEGRIDLTGDAGIDARDLGALFRRWLR